MSAQFTGPFFLIACLPSAEVRPYLGNGPPVMKPRFPRRRRGQERTASREPAAKPEPADRARQPGGPGLLLPGPSGGAGDHAAHPRAAAFSRPAVLWPSLPGLPPSPGCRGRGHIRLAGQSRRRRSSAPRRLSPGPNRNIMPATMRPAERRAASARSRGGHCRRTRHRAAALWCRRQASR